MDYKNLINVIWQKISFAPTALKISLSVILGLLVSALVIVCLSSCGALTKATIRNASDTASTTISITTNNPTKWDVSPNVSLTPKNSEK